MAKELAALARPKKNWSEMTDEELDDIAAVIVGQINAIKSCGAPVPRTDLNASQRNV